MVTLYTFNNIALSLLFLVLFTSRLGWLITFDNSSVLSVFFVFFGFFSYRKTINKYFIAILISGFIALIYSHIFRNILENGYLFNPSQYRDYGLLILISTPLLLLTKIGKNIIFYKHIFLYFFTTIALITNSRTIIYFLALLYVINIFLSPNRIRNLKFSSITLALSFLTFVSMIDENAYGDFINRIKFGISSPTRVFEVWPENIKNFKSGVHPSLHNTHNVLFHLYIFVNKFLPILAFISITFALVINSVLVYRLKLFCNLRVVLLSFSFIYFLFIYCNVESTNIWLYFFVIGLYFGFIFDLFKGKCIVKISN